MSKTPLFSFLSSLRRKILLKYSFLILLAISGLSIYSSQREQMVAQKSEEYALLNIIPASNFFNAIMHALSSIPENIKNYINVKHENDQLKERNRILEKYYKLYLQLNSENAHLKKLLNYADAENYNFISTRIALRENGPYSRLGIITAGTKDGLKDGQIAINTQGLVGRVIKTNTSSAKLLYLNDLNSKFPVITTESRTKAILAGQGNAKLSLLYLPEEANLIEGEMVVTSGDENLLPYNIPIGIIRYEDNKKLYVQPFVNIDKVEFIKIIN